MIREAAVAVALTGAIILPPEQVPVHPAPPASGGDENLTLREGHAEIVLARDAELRRLHEWHVRHELHLAHLAYLRTLKAARVYRPPLVLAGTAPVPYIPPSVSGFEACVIQRESGGNPSAVNPSSGAGGLFQFLPSTWADLGYPGLPEYAPVAEQYTAFWKAYNLWGTSPWAPYDGC